MKMFKANDASTKRIRIEPDGTFVGYIGSGIEQTQTHCGVQLN